MATFTSELPLLSAPPSSSRQQHSQGALLASVLTPIALFLHGYHPYAEDGGLYLAGVRKLLEPGLYRFSGPFVLAPTRFSAFAPLVSGLARLTHLRAGAGFETLILCLHLATIWATLYASYLLACRCWTGRDARAGAVLLLACWLSIPVAGTSLLWMDPYLTARSFSTPCTLAALLGALDATAFLGQRSPGKTRNALLLVAAALAFAALVHPLMAVYALLTVAAIALFRLPTRNLRILCLVALFAGTVASFALVAALAPDESADYTAVAFTRAYWFLSRWYWYELAGILAPTLILLTCAFAPSGSDSSRALARAGCAIAVLVTLVALLFARPDSRTHLAAGLQPLRGLQFVYLTMMLHLGALLGSKLLRHRRIAWLCALVVLGVPLFAAAHATTPASSHVELPGLASPNFWVQAFLWARDNTPADTLFALPPDYTTQAGEDAQSFRAISLRSALPDRAKDGGEAAVSPSLTSLWTEAQTAQDELASQSDATRIARLKPLGVTWLILPAAAETRLTCPYRNGAASVCRLP